MKNKLTLGILITTMNDGIERVKKNLLIQLKNVDEIVISHQIIDKDVKPEDEKKIQGEYGKHIKYTFMYDKGLSKNRNNALKYSTTDICHICDDDLNYIKGFEKIIKKEYEKSNFDIITFQAENKKGNKHFNIKEGLHNRLSVLKIWSWGVTFRRKSLINNNIYFDENFGLGTKYPVGEENIFLTDCIKKGLNIYHCDICIVIHPDESSGIDYRKNLVIARIKVFKRLFGFFGGFAGVFYFTILHYKYYKNKFGVLEFFILSFKSLINAK